MKKCASKFGIASDIYGKNEFKEIGQPLEPAPVEVSPAAGKLHPKENLYEVARQFGAEEGMEAIFIQENIDRNIDFESLTDKEAAILKTQLLSKLTPRQ